MRHVPVPKPLRPFQTARRAPRPGALAAAGALALGLPLACGETAPTAASIAPWNAELHGDVPAWADASVTCAVLPPWAQARAWALRVPETIRCEMGLLFIDHEHDVFVPVTFPLEPPRWIDEGGRMHYECHLDRGVRFRMEVREVDAHEVAIHGSLTNASEFDLERIDAQFCLVQTGIAAFEDPRGERTFLLLNGGFVPMASTEPGLPDGELPFFITAQTRAGTIEPPNMERSWLVAETARIPLIATVSEDGARFVAIAFGEGLRLMTNCEIPCIHADPRFPRCPRGETVTIEGRVYFGEGPLETVLERFYDDFPRWRPGD